MENTWECWIAKDARNDANEKELVKYAKRLEVKA